MPARHPLTLALLFSLALPAAHTAHADTNIYGEELTIIENETGLDGDELQLPSDLSPADTETQAVDAQDANAKTASNDLLQRIRSGYALPELKSPYTQNHEAWYAKRPDYVRRMMDRSQKYLFHIVGEVEKRGMPSEIALLPMVESAFNPQAYSRSHASGIWQFIPSTGKNFGLKQNWWVDNRRDVLAATDAALNYLQKLHVMFGSWELALAAYNAGEGTVMRAIERNRKKGLPTDYQSLDLPPETRNYVPKLQAVKNIVTHPQQYGLDIKPIDNKPYFTTVSAPNQIDAHLAARLAGISFDEFISLNPEYNRPVLTANGKGSHEILLPVGAEATFAENLASYDKPLVSWQTYYAKRGERQDAIAKKFGISLGQLRDINDLPANKRINAAHPLLVPSQGAGASAPLEVVETAVAAPVPETTQPQRYVVKKGDTVASIARRHGISPRQLIALNQLKSHRVKPGQTLRVEGRGDNAKPTQIAKASSKSAAKKHYVVKRGDTLSTIARKFDVAINDIRRWNKLRGNHITPGDKLTIHTSAA